MENQNFISNIEFRDEDGEISRVGFARSHIDSRTQSLLYQLKDQFYLCFKDSHENDFDLLIVQDIESRDVISLFQSGAYYYDCLEKISEKHGEHGEEYTTALLKVAYWHYLSASMQDDDSEQKWVDVIASTRFLGYISGRRNAPISELVKLAEHGSKFPSGRTKDQPVDDHLRYLKKVQGVMKVKQLFDLADQSILKDMPFPTFKNRMSLIKLDEINHD